MIGDKKDKKMKKTYFKYCSYCKERFTPDSKEVRICKKCNQKVYLLINLNQKLKQLKLNLPSHDLIENKHKENINKIIIVLEKEVNLLNKELKK